MKALFFMLLVLPSMALPTLEEARSRLGSTNAKERSAITLDIWKAGKASLPLLQTLSELPEPEIANRAAFILRRLRMGLNPDSSEELLELAETLEQSTPPERLPHLTKLIAHRDGAPIALALLDQWACHESQQPERLLNHAALVTEALLEQRNHWENFFTAELSPQCRAAIIAAVAARDNPMKSQIISILATGKTHHVYESLQKMVKSIDGETSQSIARIAIIAQDLPLALRILRESLATAQYSDQARALAYLQASSGTPPPSYHGAWKHELSLFQARSQADQAAVQEITSKVLDQQLLKYESMLITGLLALPPTKGDADPLHGELAIKALHTAFGSPPHQPDMEALTATTLIDKTVLARTLTLLSSPLEAAEILSANGQEISATNLLWHTGHRNKANTLAQEILTHLDGQEEAKMRLALCSLHLAEGDKEAARAVFTPLLKTDLMRNDLQSTAIALGLQLYPRETIIPLAPNLKSIESYQRAPAIARFLPLPNKVSATWYEYFLAEDHSLSPGALFQKIETFLGGDRQEAREIISKKLAESTENPLLPNDPLYQNILFLKLPEALDIVTKAAWYQLSTQDLFAIIRDDSWPEETRREALKTALLIDPTHATLRWYDLGNEGAADLKTLHHLTLGKAGLALQLAAHTGKRDSLELTAMLSDVRDPNALRCLTLLAKFHLQNKEPAKAVRLFQVAFFGEIVAGSYPATPITNILENLGSYLEARAMITDQESEKKHWESQLQAIRKDS